LAVVRARVNWNEKLL